MDFKLQMGRLLYITMGHLFHVWGGVGGVGVGLFCFLLFGICTELLCFGRGI